MKFDPADLVLFACVVEEGSFSGAAERLDIPNSTVSRRISALENQLGERLIVRTTRKMMITEYGKAVLRHAQQISAEMEAMLALTENRQAKPTGQLRISMPGDFSQNLIGALLADFIEKYPQVTLDIDSSQQRVDIIGEGYDIALRMGNLQNDSTLVARQLSTFRVGLYAAPSFIKKHGRVDHPQDLMQRSVLRLRTRGGDVSPWTLTKQGECWEGSPPMRAVANSPSVLINLARLGAGITSVTTHFAHPYLETGELVRVLEDWECPGVPVWAVFPGRRLMPSRTRVFIDSLVASFEKFTSRY
ncbi:LysR substrate-binding domain-containing protein [Rouxiella sp. WC2420]|uniref:LysR substrate-binding domain-containing protein n=1 Tax=Rouxiella sp. WC2420 TaxID=3234145 RepID=A0AB39VKQ3_9GAMM